MDSEAQFDARIDVRNDVANIALSGELDLATVPLLDDRLTRLEDDGVKAIMLDLRDISFLDCAALGAFMSARERAQRNGHSFVLIGASSRARRLFRLTRTEFLLAEQDPAAALDQFTHGQSGHVSQPVGVDDDAHAV
ncbi:MAG TPA: STAS domain-containing protein [Actinomycetes bacterium]|nr:STAS domain-containing protein [Actinomycetes bacterium]